MKLRNKKTGEIGNLKPYGGDEKIWVWIDNKSKPEYRYNSLAELNEEWEDVPEEPKEYWYISDFGYVFNHEINNKSVKSTIEEMKSIGNYFSSREEAELAVRKLKAWKRLKDKGFRFNGWSGTQMGSDISYIREIYYEGCTDDMDLLFGGEE